MIGKIRQKPLSFSSSTIKFNPYRKNVSQGFDAGIFNRMSADLPELLKSSIGNVPVEFLSELSTISILFSSIRAC